MEKATQPASAGPARRALIVTAVFLLTAVSALQAPFSVRAEDVCAQAGGITRELAEITGLELRHPVPCASITREEVNRFLKERIRETGGPDEIRAEELTLKKFGLVPPDFDLAGTTIDLLTEQAAAFYDFRRKKLFITESAASAAQEPILAHELSHALADQHFNLEKYIEKARDDDDGAAARMAVMEGQATWLMSEYTARKLGQSLQNSPELASLMSRLSEASGRFPVFDKSPLYLRLSLLFPYTEGMLFQDALVRRNGKSGFAQPFRNPPISTQQVAHPDAYFSSTRPARPALPKVALPRSYKELIGGTLGELDHRILIEQFAGRAEADKIAPHWRGSSFELREDRRAGRVVLLYSVEWDSAETARRYFEFYKSALAKKWKTFSVSKETADSQDGTGDDGRFRLQLNGTVFASMEGLPSEIK